MHESNILATLLNLNAFGKVDRACGKAARASDVGEPIARVLMMLSQNPGLTDSALRKRLDMSSSQLSRIMTRLIADNLVDVSAARSIQQRTLSLSAEGAVRAEAVKQLYLEAIKRTLAKLAPIDREAVLSYRPPRLINPLSERIEIRLARTGDVLAALNLIAGSSVRERERLTELIGFFATALQRWWHDHEGLPGYVAIDEDNQLVGFCLTATGRPTFDGKWEETSDTYLNLFLSPLYQRPEVETALLQHCVVAAAKHDLGWLSTYVSRSDKALVQLLEDHGFHRSPDTDEERFLPHREVWSVFTRMIEDGDGHLLETLSKTILTESSED